MLPTGNMARRVGSEERGSGWCGRWWNVMPMPGVPVMWKMEKSEDEDKDEDEEGLVGGRGWVSWV